MNGLKIIQTLTLATLLVLALGACSNRDTNDTNATGQTAGTTQDAGERGSTTNSTGTTTSSGGGTQSTGGGSTDANSNDSNDGTATGSDSGNTDSSTSTENNSNNTSDDNTVEDNTTSQYNNASADNNTTHSADNNTSTETNSTVDVTPPVLTLNGESNITLEQNAVYTELGATAVDAVDGNVSVTITGNVDIATVGSYTVTYTAQDSAGNEANVTRSITVIDVIPPVITLNSDANITLEQNENYTELGARAVDAVDGNLTVSISGAVDTGTVGNYTLTYTATDSAGNEANVTRSVEVVNTIPTLTSITLESNATTVNVGDTVQLTVTGTYSDGNSATVDENITYSIHPAENVEVNGSVLRAKKDGKVTVQASIDGVNSNTIALNITWVVNGHVIPPEPDKALNDSTLLGIDVNDNGVRDDVERWIYQNYKDKHPIHVDIGMQMGRASKKILEKPLKNINQVKIIHNIETNAMACEAYYKVYAKYFNEPLLVTKDIGVGNLEYIYFNTLERRRIYKEYAQLLSGYTYSTPKIDTSKFLCDFNTTKYKK